MHWRTKETLWTWAIFYGLTLITLFLVEHYRLWDKMYFAAGIR